MSHTIARIILAITMLIAAPIVYMVLFVIIERTVFRADRHALLASGIVTALLITVLWIVVWRPCVLWTRSRRLLTVLSIFWSLGLAVVIGVIVEAFSRRRGGISEETILLACHDVAAGLAGQHGVDLA